MITRNDFFFQRKKNLIDGKQLVIALMSAILS
jgi:hypothetical protein